MEELTRRRLLQGTAGLAVGGLAGCAGTPNSASDDPAASPAPDVSPETETGDDHGGDDHSHGGVGESKESAEVLVNTARGEDSAEFHFNPHVTRVETGGSVTWTLESGNHTATAYHPENDQPKLVPDGTAAWDSGMLSEEGESYERTFDTEGVFHYYCEPHEQFGMIATVVVGDPDPADQVVLQELPEDKSETVRTKLEELNGMVRTALVDDGHHDEEEDGHHTEQEDGHHTEEEDDDHHD